MFDWLIILLISVVAFFVFAIVLTCISAKKSKTQSDTEVPDDCTEFEYIDVHAKVIDQICSTEMVGFKQPKSVKYFCICFEDDNKKTYKLSVPEEEYLGYEIGMTGILTMVDGTLYSFVPDNI
jgi:hypothetical protein